MNTIPHVVQWHEGMLVGPHHFQQAFLRQDGILSFHLQNIAPYYWGIRKLEINKSMLVSGKFYVDQVEAVMPDGLEVFHSKDIDPDLEIDLKLYKDDIKKGDLTVFLVVPAQSLDQTVGKGELARYKSIKGELIGDANTGENPLLIPRLKPALSLMIVDELSAKYIGFPLAKVTFKDANFMLTEYVPPGISLSALPKIETMGRELIQQLREKASFLSEKMKATSTATGLPMILETKDMIRSVVTALPQFEVIMHSPELHPFLLYQSLAVLSGQISSLDPGFIPPIPEPYDHNNLYDVFKTSYDYIMRITEQGIQEKYTCLTFSYNPKEFCYNVKLDRSWITEELIIGVRGQPGMNQSEVEEWVSKCVIGSESVLPSMRERRISGVRRNSIEGNEFLVPLRGVRLFSIIVSKEFIKGDENLSIVNPANQIPGTQRADEIVLYVENSLMTPAEKLQLQEEEREPEEVDES